GDRHTDVGIVVTEEDIIALSAAMLTNYRDKETALQQHVDRLQTTVDNLTEAFEKIGDLVSRHADDAPSPDHLLNAVEKIAYHFVEPAGADTSPRISWIEWKRI